MTDESYGRGAAIFITREMEEAHAAALQMIEAEAEQPAKIQESRRRAILRWLPTEGTHDE